MVRLILFIVIGLLVLSFFGISLQGLITAPATQENLSYFWSLVEAGFDKLIALIVALLNPVLRIFGISL